MNDCNSSSYYYNSTPITGTSNSIEWQGGDIACLDICNGSRLTEVETKIANRLCELIDFTNTENVILPECLVNAWGTKDKTVLEFIQFILDQHCNQQSQIDTINSTLGSFDPLITVDYKCCSNSPCVTTGTVALSVALQNIINCLCTQSARIDELESDLAVGLQTILSYQSQLSLFSVQLTNFNSALQANSASIATHKTAINCLINQTGSSCTEV